MIYDEDMVEVLQVMPAYLNKQQQEDLVLCNCLNSAWRRKVLLSVYNFWVPPILCCS